MSQMGLLGRLRSDSAVERRPPYATSSQVVARTLSVPDLPTQSADFFDDSSLYTHDVSSTPPTTDSSAASKRVSVTSLPPTAEVPPPDYDKKAAPRSPRTIVIVPRAEEGRETLPDYSPSIVQRGVLNRKMELVSPHRPSIMRSWNSFFVVLNNTRLDLLSMPRRGSTESGTLVKSYTLQYAEIGLALDYNKKDFAIRMRAESEQFLFACESEEACIQWVNAIQTAIDLALPLDERKLPRLRTVPNRRNPGLGHRSQRSRWSRSSSSTSTSSRSPAAAASASSTSASPSPASRPSSIHQAVHAFSRLRVTTSAGSTESTDEQAQLTDDSYDEDDTSSNRHDADIDLSGHKWNPEGPQENARQVMRYAGRCLPILRASTPWINKTVIIKGRKYLVRRSTLEQISIPPVLAA